MTDNVIEHDFGKEDREIVRKFLRLRGLADELEADVLAHPMKHLVMASQEMAKLRRDIFEAWEVVALATSVQVGYLSDERPPDLSPALALARVDAKELTALREAYRRIAVLAGMRAEEPDAAQSRTSDRAESDN